MIKSRGRGVLDRPVKPDDDSFLWSERAPHSHSSSPGLTGRPSIPETLMMESRGRGVLHRPVKPDDDNFLWSEPTVLCVVPANAGTAGEIVFNSNLQFRMPRPHILMMRSP